MSENEREYRCFRRCLLSKNDIRDEIRRQNRSRDRGEQVHQITAHTAWIHASLMNGMWNLYGIMLKLAEKLSASHTPLFSFCCWHFAACSLCMMLKLILWYIECLHWAHCITHHKHITHHPTDFSHEWKTNCAIKDSLWALRSHTIHADNIQSSVARCSHRQRSYVSPSTELYNVKIAQTSVQNGGKHFSLAAPHAHTHISGPFHRRRPAVLRTHKKTHIVA